MSDDFDPDPLFTDMRDSIRRAAVAPAADVRRRGHQRQVRARVLTATTAVVVLTGGAGVAFAATHGSARTHLQPGHHTPSATTPVPSIRATHVPATPPAPTTSAAVGSPASAVRTVPAPPSTPHSSTTSHNTPPRTVTTTPATTPATSRPATKTPPAPLTTAPAEYVTVTLTTKPGKGQFTWLSVASGMVAQTYGADNKVIPGGFQFQSSTVELDGKTIDGGEAGDIHCPAGSPIVHSTFTEKSQAPVVVKAGVHTLTVTVKSCDGVLGSRTVTFTVG